MKKFISFFWLAIITLPLFSQGRLQYWGNTELYIQDQASIIIEEVYKVLSVYPPGTTVGSERKTALFALDALLHDTRLDNGTSFRAYMDKMAGDIAADLQKNKPSGKEVRFFRFYNHGFIVQTSTVTIAFDLVRAEYIGSPAPVSESSMRSIVQQCDILFISHKHADHADYSVAKMFYEQGKNVIVPEEMWNDLSPQVRVLRGTDMIQETIGSLGLTVCVYPGRQGTTLNNVYIVTLPEGQTIMHTGDQDASTDLDAKVAPVKVDVLLVHCWMIPMERFVSAVQPALVITGHENEMGHTIDHREAYWLTFRRMFEVTVPYIVMAWGESYSF